MSIPVDEPSYDEDPWGYSSCDADVAVVVDGVWIPTTFVQTTVANDGVLDQVRLTEVKFPTEWEGKSVVDHIKQFEPGEQSGYSIGKVYYREELSQQWFLVHRGWVRGVGGTNTTGVSKLWLDDPSNFLTAIPFSRAYEDPTTRTVTTDIIDEFTDNTVFDDVRVGAPIPQSLDAEEFVFSIALATNNIPKAIELALADLLTTTKTFKSNRHTLADAVNYVAELTGSRTWFEPTENGLVLVLDHDYGAQKHFASEELDDYDDSVPLRVIENDAIDEIKPINSVRINGSSAASIAGFSIRQLPSGTYPTALASYEPLVERTGNRLPGTIVDAETTTVAETENLAKVELANRILGNGQGDIITYGRPDMGLRDRLTVVPYCAGVSTQSNATPLDYQALKTVHTYENGLYTTRTNVSVFVDYSEIEIVESGMEET